MCAHLLLPSAGRLKDFSSIWIWRETLRDYYEQLYGYKMDNLKEMDRFLEKFNLPILNQEEIEIMSNPMTSTEIETVIKNSAPPKKSLGPDGFTGELYQTFSKELMPILPKLFKKLQRKEHFQAHSMRPPSP